MATSTFTGSTVINGKTLTWRYDIGGSYISFSDGTKVLVANLFNFVDLAKAYASVAPVVTQPVTGFNPTLIPEELIGTNIYDATQLLNASGKACADQESVWTWVDRKGGANLTSRSVTPTPAIYGKLPWLISSEREVPAVRFFNTTHLDYGSAVLPVKTFPYAIRDIFEILPGQAWEGIADGGNPGDGFSAYKGILGYGGARAGGSDATYYSLPNTNLKLNQRVDWLTVFNSKTIDSYVNGVLKDSIPMPAKSVNYVGLDAITKNTIAVSSNSLVMLYSQKITYYGKDYTNLMADFANINAKIGAKWSVGEINPNPHAVNPTADDELMWYQDKATGSLIPTCSFVNATPAQIAAAQYAWYADFAHSGPEPGAFTRIQKFSSNKIANISDIKNLKYTATTGGPLQSGEVIGAVQSIFYVVSTPGYLESKGQSQDVNKINIV